jgi:parafibromin
MASEPEQNDPLLVLRHAIGSGTTPLLSTSEDPSTATPDFAQATHIHFTTPVGQKVFPLSAETRYASDSKPTDLRSVYFVWLHKDDTTTAYIAARTSTNKELVEAGNVGGEINNLPFTDRTDLVAWLDGTNEESENIKPLDAQKAAAQAERAAAITAGTATGAAPAPATSTVTVSKTLDPKLAKIYAGERKMGDRNSILRGIKPTVSILTATDSRAMF